jgi:hypothetical protein
MNMYNLLCVSILSLVITGCVYSTEIKPFDCISCVQIRVGAPEYVYGPGPAPMDNPFFSLVDASGMLYGYSANGDTKLIIKSELNNTIRRPSTALEGGDRNEFDECGSWLNTAFVEGDIVRGWYHAEGYCDYENSQTYKSIAYCESHDGGLTFEKLDYPDNQIITGARPRHGKTTGNGDQSVIKGDDGFYYVFFINWDDFGYSVARSPVSSGGVPGTWNKYYEGDWSEPGLGGNSSRVDWLQGSTIYKHRSGNLISVGYGAGFTLAFGEDPVTWGQLDEPLLFAEGQWVRTHPSRELIGYPALVPMEGGTDPLDNKFWLYYTYLEPSAGFVDRYLVRRQVELVFSNSTEAVAKVGVELSRYTSGNATWVTTTLPISGGFSYNQSMGYVLTAEARHTVPLYDCYIDMWDDYIVGITSCEDVSGFTFLRQIGWVYAGQRPHTSPLYRCWNVETLKHSVSRDIDCEGNGYNEFILGWILDV